MTGKPSSWWRLARGRRGARAEDAERRAEDAERRAQKALLLRHRRINYDDRLNTEKCNPRQGTSWGRSEASAAAPVAQLVDVLANDRKLEHMKVP